MRPPGKREPEHGEEVEQAAHFRRKPRSGRRVSVHFVILDGSERGPARAAVTSNIGVGGAFVVTGDPPPPGTALILQLTVPPADETVELRGEVRWIAGRGHQPDGDDAGDELGMGIHFAPLEEPTHARLTEYFASLTPTVDHDEGL